MDLTQILEPTRSSFGIDVGFSYGQSEDAAPSWQSAGALYNSNATVSYKPDKLPGVSLTAAAGNYDHNAITYGGTLSEPICDDLKWRVPQPHGGA